MVNYAQARQDAYYNGDFDAIERIIDAEAAGIPLSPESTVSKRKGPLHLIDPGAGAIDYARELVAGLTQEEAASIIRRLLSEKHADKRVKRCDYCGYPWRDVSLRNTRHTCSDECKTGIRTIQRSQQRADKALLSGKTKKVSKRDDGYLWWLEYPFWIQEYEMLKWSWKREVPHGIELLDFVTTQRATMGEGNRKKKAHKPGYEDELMGRNFNKATINKLRRG